MAKPSDKFYQAPLCLLRYPDPAARVRLYGIFYAGQKHLEATAEENLPRALDHNDRFEEKAEQVGLEHPLTEDELILMWGMQLFQIHWSEFKSLSNLLPEVLVQANHNDDSKRGHQALIRMPADYLNDLQGPKNERLFRVYAAVISVIGRRDPRAPFKGKLIRVEAIEMRAFGYTKKSEWDAVERHPNMSLSKRNLLTLREKCDRRGFFAMRFDSYARTKTYYSHDCDRERLSDWVDNKPVRDAEAEANRRLAEQKRRQDVRNEVRRLQAIGRTPRKGVNKDNVDRANALQRAARSQRATEPSNWHREMEDRTQLHTGDRHRRRSGLIPYD